MDDTKKHRHSIRLKGYDYASEGAYFITLCVKNREMLFGEITDELNLNQFGKIAFDEWYQTPSIRPNVVLDAFVVMPNHIHGIIIITYNCMCANNGRGVLQYAPTGNTENIRNETGMYQDDDDQCGVNKGRDVLQYAPTNNPQEKGLRSPSQTIGAIVRGYKASVTKKINALRNTPGESVWQRNYYEHIIRNDDDLDRIRGYISNNPLRWATDEYNEKEVCV